MVVKITFVSLPNLYISFKPIESTPSSLPLRLLCRCNRHGNSFAGTTVTTNVKGTDGVLNDENPNRTLVASIPANVKACSDTLLVSYAGKASCVRWAAVQVRAFLNL